MADEKKPIGAAATPAATSTKKKRWLPKMATWQWVALICLSTLLTHGLLWFVRPAGVTPTVATGEVSLGQFQFVNHELNPDEAGVTQAKFDLHVQLLEDVSRPARARLEVRQFKIQQDIEELLRQAHAADFDDPTLTELKRQLQEKINTTMEMRAIEEVIITRLTVEGRPQSLHDAALGEKPAAPPAAFMPETVGAAPEKSPSPPG